MERVIIIGAGGFGREVLAWLEHANEAKHYHVIGFLDQNPNALNQYSIATPIIGSPQTYAPKEDDLFICAIGNTGQKLRICRDLKARGGKFLTFVHPAAIVGQNCILGEGCILCPGSVVTANATLGCFVCLNVYATVGHDAVLRDGCTLSGHCDVTGFASLGEGVFMGSHASVLPKVKVGDYAIIGAGSVVVKKVRPGTTVFGVPAKQLAGFKVNV